MELKRLIEQAQNGDQEAKSSLIEAMLRDKCMRRLNRYLYRNRLLSPDDTKGEFWLGVVQAMATVKYDIGDPLQYLAQRGIWQVREALRNAISRGVRYECNTCGHKGRYRRRTNEIRCGRCNGTDLESRQIEIVLQDKVSVDARTAMAQRMDIADFKTILTPREAEVLEAILTNFDRDNSKNYLKDVAGHMNVSPQCVVQYLKRIRWKWSIFKRYL